MTDKNEDELALLATDKEFKRVFKKAMSELEKNEVNEYKYKIHINRVVPLLRSFIFISKRIYDEARADQFREDTDERVQSIKDAKQEQLAEDIKKFRKLILEEADIGHPDTYEDGRSHYDCLECAQTDMAKRLLEALQQSNVKSD